MGARILDGPVEEAAVNRKTSVKAKAPLAVRIALVALAVVLLAVGLLAMVNLTAMGNYNQATQRLNENIKLVQQEDADLDKQYASQQQTDAQFEDAGAFSALLLPSLREDIDYNSGISSRLTKLMEQQLSATDEQSSTDATEDSTGGTVESGTAGGSLTDEQLKKVEELLKQNTSSTQSDGNDDSSGSATSGNESDSSQAKPW